MSSYSDKQARRLRPGEMWARCPVCQQRFIKDEENPHRECAQCQDEALRRAALDKDDRHALTAQR